MEVPVLTREKKKIEIRKIIYRKLRQPQKKNTAKMVTLAAFMMALALFVPGICTGIEIPDKPVPEFPTVLDPDTGEDAQVLEVEEEDSRPSKLQSEPSGISGQSTSTYHI